MPNQKRGLTIVSMRINKRKFLFLLALTTSLFFQRVMPCNAICLKQMKAADMHDCCAKGQAEKVPTYKSICCQDSMNLPQVVRAAAPIQTVLALEYSEESISLSIIVADSWKLSHPPPLETDFISSKMRSLHSVNLLI